MQYIEELVSLKLEGCALTIGSFDGVHLGHKALIESTVADARKLDLPAVVLTFYPHPSVVLRSRSPAYYITSPKEKRELLGELNVDIGINQQFDKKLSKVRATDFLDQLDTHLSFRSLWVGEDFALGHRREGNQLFLERESERRGFDLYVVPPVFIDGEVVSSTRVREALRAGDVSRVASYLGRPFGLSGEVVEGAGRGKELGIPTANLKIWDEHAYPGPGVYVCRASVAGQTWDAVSNIGVRPTFGDGPETPIVEAHLLDFEDDLYGQTMRLTFIARLRDERRFPSPEALLRQVERDISRARELLGRPTEL